MKFTLTLLLAVAYTTYAAPVDPARGGGGLGEIVKDVENGVGRVAGDLGLRSDGGLGDTLGKVEKGVGKTFGGLFGPGGLKSRREDAIQPERDNGIVGDIGVVVYRVGNTLNRIVES